MTLQGKSQRQLGEPQLNPTHLIASGFCFGLTDSDKHFLRFDPTVGHCWCNLCGAVYQNPEIAERRRWSHSHAELAHNEAEHRNLVLSGRRMTPAAQYILAAYGIISVTDLQLHEDNRQAGLEAPRCIMK